MRQKLSALVADPNTHAHTHAHTNAHTHAHTHTHIYARTHLAATLKYNYYIGQ